MAFLRLAHRGACRQAPENTLAAFELALAAGCDGCECDVQLSRDGQLVVFHDDTLKRLVGIPERVPDLSAAELGVLRVRNRHRAVNGIPTLEAVWRLHEARRRHLFVEVKYFHEAHTPRAALVRAVLAFVRAHAPNPRAFIITFDEAILQQLKAAQPSLRTGFIFNNPRRFAQAQFTWTAWADALLPRADCVTPALMAQVTATTRPVYPWVADDERAMARLARLGADGVLSNEPQRLVAWAQRQRP